MFLVSLTGFVVLALVVAPLWDGIAAVRRWRGLRLTSLSPGRTFVFATLASLIYLAILWSSADRVFMVASSLLAIPATVFLVLLRGRNLQPHTWNKAGTWDTHRASAVEIPMAEGYVPALVFEPATPSDAAVLLLHGAGAHKTYYSWPLLDGLLDAGITVCAIDIDGHGDNQRTLDFPGVLENVSAPIAWLRERSAWVGVVGVSLGGCIAAHAVARGVQIEALALLEAPADAQVNRRATRNERWTVARRATWELHQYAGTLPLITGWRTAPTRSRIGTLDLIRRLDLPGSLPQIECPLLLLYGSSDLVVPIEQAAMLAAAAPPGTPLHIVPGATHLSLPIDRRAIRRLTDWLHSFVEYGSLADITPKR